MGFPYDGTGFEPAREFLIGTSDYTDLVIRWPVINRQTNQFKSTSVRIELANAEQELNTFYTNLYTMPLTCTIACDSYTLYTGFLKDVQYKNEKCLLTLRDRLSDFEVRKIGDSSDVASFEPQIPSDIAWTICTCYGDLDDTETTSNTDIDYTSFLLWAETFSVDQIELEANYSGQKLAKAMTDLAQMTNSDIWIKRDGKIKFKARVDVSSNDIIVDYDYIADMAIRIAGDELVTDQYVYGTYSSDNNRWEMIVHHTNPTYVSSYGLREDVIKSTELWFTNSSHALNLAQKRVANYGEPPIRFSVKAPFALINSTISDRIRLVDSYFAITSEYAWRITGEQIDIEEGIITFELDSTKSMEPFFLDLSLLDGLHLLL